MSIDSFASLDVLEAGVTRYGFHSLSGMMPEYQYGTAQPTPCLRTMPGYHLIAPDYNTSGRNNGLFSKDGTFSPKFIFDDAYPNGLAYGMGFVHSDILLALSPASTTWYGVNLRQTGAARNINNTAAAAGTPLAPYTTAGYGIVAMPTLGTAPYYDSVQYDDARFLVTASTADTTSPTVAAPSAPSVSAGTSGGYLADAAYGVKIAWVTRLNTYKNGCGITIASAEATATVSGGSGAGKLDVTIPTIATNAIGYVVFVGASGGPWYAAGGGNVAGTHTVKATMAQLAMANRLYIAGQTTIYEGVVVNLENASPITWGTARTVTSGFNSPMWSPYFKDPSLLHMLPYSQAVSCLLKTDQYLITAGTIALNQTVGWNGEPAIIQSSSAASTGHYTTYCSVPELMAYAVGWLPYTNGTTWAGNVQIQLRSCLSNEILWQWCAEDVMPATLISSGGNTYRSPWFGFETINGATYCLVASARHRGVLRVPVIMWS